MPTAIRNACAALVLTASLGLSPSLLRAAPVRGVGPTGSATGASMGAAGAALRPPLADLLGSRGLTLGHAAHEWAIGQVAAALTAQGISGEALVKAEPQAALAQVDAAVRARVRETAERILADKGSEGNYARGLHLMKLRALLRRSLDDETLQVLDQAYEAAQDQFAGSAKAAVLAQFKRMAASGFIAETGMLSAGVEADLKSFDELPGAGELDAARFERGAATAFGLAAPVEAGAVPRPVPPVEGLPAAGDETLVLRLSRPYVPSGRPLDVEVVMAGGAPRLRLTGRESSAIRESIEGLQDHLAALERERASMLRSAPADAADREEIRFLNLRIARVRQELDSVTAIIRRQLAHNDADILWLKARLEDPEYEAPAPEVHSQEQRIARLEEENSALKASLPRSKLRRWLAHVWDATAKAYAKAGEYSIK